MFLSHVHLGSIASASGAVEELAFQSKEEWASAGAVEEFAFQSKEEWAYTYSSGMSVSV